MDRAELYFSSVESSQMEGRLQYLFMVGQSRRGQAVPPLLHRPLLLQLTDSVQMSIILPCSHPAQPPTFIGIDASCSLPAVFCVQHSPHLTKDGLLHQMMPLGQFRRNLNDQKFKMGDKVAVLTEQYSAFMDDLIREITELKLRKVVQLSMLWLRELASTEEEYETLRRVYRNDYQGLTCKDAHSLYFKVVGNETLQNRPLEEIECYRQICGVMATLQNSVKARMAILERVGELEGVVQKGELLKRALPDRRVLKENTKEILLEPRNPSAFEVKYNRVVVKEGTRSFQSVFSKYPLIDHTNYHLLVTTKYTNVLVGLCREALKQDHGESSDLHYNPHSITFNCSNGCLYRDGMFQSGASHLTKGQKVLQLIIRATDREMLILLGKNVLCRTNIEAFRKDSKFYLHILMRTQGDAVEIDRDRSTGGTQEYDQGLIEPSKAPISVSDVIVEEEASEVQEMQSISTSPKNSLDVVLQLGKKDRIAPPPSIPKIQPDKPTQTQVRPAQILIQNARRRTNPPMQSSPMYESLFKQRNTGPALPANSANLLQSAGLKESLPMGSSFDRGSKGSRGLKAEERSKIEIQVENSMVASEPEEASSRYASNVYGEPTPHAEPPQRQSLINPAVMLPLKKSQFEFSLRSSAIDINSNNRVQSPNTISPLPSMKYMKKRASDLSGTLGGIRGTQMEDDWIG